MIIGVLSIHGSEADGYTGHLDTDRGSARVTEISVSGHWLTFLIPDVDARIELHFTGDEFSGGITRAMGTASITGTRRARG